MTDCLPSNTPLEETGFGYTLSLIGNISFRTLSNTLKELERDELIIRKEYPQIPPKVEYRLSERGQSLIPLLDMMCQWGERNMNS